MSTTIACAFQNLARPGRSLVEMRRGGLIQTCLTAIDLARCRRAARFLGLRSADGELSLAECLAETICNTYRLQSEATKHTDWINHLNVLERAFAFANAADFSGDGYVNLAELLLLTSSINRVLPGHHQLETKMVDMTEPFMIQSLQMPDLLDWLLREENESLLYVGLVFHSIPLNEIALFAEQELTPPAKLGDDVSSLLYWEAPTIKALEEGSEALNLRRGAQEALANTSETFAELFHGFEQCDYQEYSVAVSDWRALLSELHQLALRLFGGEMVHIESPSAGSLRVQPHAIPDTHGYTAQELAALLLLHFKDPEESGVGPLIEGFVAMCEDNQAPFCNVFAAICSPIAMYMTRSNFPSNTWLHDGQFVESISKQAGANPEGLQGQGRQPLNQLLPPCMYI